MVFSSVPAAYLDPSNWHPQQPQSVGEDGNYTHEVSPVVVHESGGGGSLGKPCSIPDRSSKLAAKPPQPAVLKCPRCESTNTKFCYFNNYNLSQPRHFCKTCRRYWTRGGALRNVPVGGGCRRNNKTRISKGKGSCSSNNRSKSPSAARCSTDNIGHLAIPRPPELAFLPSSLHHHHHHLNNIDHHGAGGLTTFGVGGIPTPTAGSNDIHDLISIGGNTNSQYWRSQHQFPFWEAPTANAGSLMYHHQLESSEGPSSSSYAIASPRGVNIQADDGSAGTFKMEENHDQGLNLSKRFNLGISSATHDNNINLHYFWGISSNANSQYPSSSTNHVL